MQAIGSRFEVRVSRDRARVVEAQRLRYRVFAQEPGFATTLDRAGVDEDRFDIHCEHLIVRDTASGDVVGTFRILAPDAARRAGSYHAQDCFDLSLLDVLRDRMVEVGRACVHPDYRSANVNLMLWSALARYLVEHGYDYVLGTASISLADGGHRAASLFRAISQHSMSPEDLRALPRRRLPLESLTHAIDARPQKSLRAHLDLGAWACGEPGKDRHSMRADIPLLLPLARMRDPFARRFLARAA